MPGVYAICLDPFVPPVQHARCKVLMEYREAIKKLLQDMVDQGIITPVTEPMGWVTSLIYPQKPDGSLHICLDPKDLNKEIIQEHYKASTLDEITHKLSGAKVFSKLGAKDGFWSIHTIILFNHLQYAQGSLLVPLHALQSRTVSRCVSLKMCFRCGWTRSPIGFLAS